MTKLNPSLPDDTRVLFNYLYDGAPVTSLGEDVFCAVLPSGVLVDVGWFPESDPAGTYIVRTYADGSEHEIDRFETNDVRKASDCVQRFAFRRRVGVTRTVFQFESSTYSVGEAMRATYQSDAYSSPSQEIELV